MTKKKPSPQNRIWEKERRDRLNQTFDNLSKLLPEYEPATQLSKIEILQRAVEYVEKLQNKIKAFLEERDALLKKHVDELEERLQVLIARNEDLAALLKKANINVPPCKLGPISGKDSPVEKLIPAAVQSTKLDEKLPSKSLIDVDAVDPGAKTESTSIQTVSVSSSVITTTASSNVVPITGITSNVAPAVTNAATVASVPVIVSSSVPSACLVVANNHIVGTLNQANVNVTPALLPTPIMATGVIISNNGNLLQMPLAVPSTSSLLIVSNEDVRSKLSLRKTRGSPSKSASAKGNSLHKGKFTIKSIEVIPGRIVNGKIPIPPLKRPAAPIGKGNKEKRKRQRKRKSSEHAVNQEEAEAKKVKIDDKKEEGVKDDEKANNQAETNSKESPPANSIAQIQEDDAAQVDDRASSLEMNLDQGDLSADIFANLQVPDEETDGNQGSLSPTAAYLMNFPLVSTGGKASGIHVECSNEPEATECIEGDKKASLQTTENNLLLDNFSSYFTPSIYGTLDNVTHPVSDVTPSTSAGALTSFSTIYQSIDSMLEHKPSRVTASSDCRYNSTPFTFTLTSTSNSAPTQSYDYRHSSSTGYFYSTTTSTAKPMDDFCLLKPSIATEFTFSLTSTIQSGPKTVQSQYTNSTIFSSTVTTPSYSIYGSQTKSSKTANYNANYIPEAAKSEQAQTPKKYDILEAEKPATNFTFSLTSTTKTNAKYSYPAIVTSCSTYTTPYATTSASSYAKVEDCLYKSSKTSTSHNPYKTPPKQKPNHYSSLGVTQPNVHNQAASHSQTKYDVNWMASQDPKPSVNNQDYSQHLPSFDFNGAPTHSYQTNIDLSRKSDIFFAHPSGEDNLMTWSPNKLTNILNDTNSSYYPSTTTSLPSLQGDLALNGPSTTTKSSNNLQRKANDTSSTFLSVQQLVDQPRKSSTNNKSYNSTYSNFYTNQKPLNNNYSAEALIGSSTGSSTKKEKFYTDTSYNTYGTFQTDSTSGAGLSFNFDYSSDYSKNYNYGCQQNYMPSFVDNGYSLSTVPSATVTTLSSSFPTTTCYSSYSHSSDRKQPSSSSTNYYQNSYQPDIPYYVPSPEKRSHTSSKSRKQPKQSQSHDFTSLPNILPSAPPLSTLSEDPLFYNPISVTTTTSYQQLPPYQSNLPNYSFGSQPYQPSSSLSSSVAVGVSSSSTLTNFNLSTICPEISEKSGGSGSGLASHGHGTAVATVTGGSTIARHPIAGVGGW
ncbi:mucin-5AC-like isoform X2 [Armigeres subalbatus]|uniref:mucin-5AC-like isoform X2 n=1 Tax=Armigeres subalbatus TaxID=124917 RepID=UPI002ECFDEEB